jgi:hypothetical protein
MFFSFGSSGLDFFRSDGVVFVAGVPKQGSGFGHLFWIVEALGDMIVHTYGKIVFGLICSGRRYLSKTLKTDQTKKSSHEYDDIFHDDEDLKSDK